MSLDEIKSPNCPDKIHQSNRRSQTQVAKRMVSDEIDCNRIRARPEFIDSVSARHAYFSRKFYTMKHCLYHFVSLVLTV